MTVPATSRRAGPFSGNGVTTSFPFTFRVFTSADIRVVRANSLGVETALVLDSDYTVTLNSDQDSSPGGSVTYPASGAPLDDLETLTIVGALDYEQTLDLPGGGAFSPTALENALDRTVIQVQQLAEEGTRALTLPVSSTADPELPAPEAGKLIGWDQDASALVNVDVNSLASVVAFGQRRTLIADGGEASYTLAADPGSVHNTVVAVSGVVQTPNVDYTLSGVTLTPTAEWPAGTGNVVIMYGESLPEAVSSLPFKCVTEWGVVGDGATDDWANATEAANDCAGAYRLYWPAGTYMMSQTLRVPSNSYWFGDGAASVIKTLPAALRTVSTVLTGEEGDPRENIVLDNLTIDFNSARWTNSNGTGRASTQTALAICNSQNVYVSRVRALNGYKHSIDITAPFYNDEDTGSPTEYFAEASYNVWLKDCYATGGGDDNITTHHSYNIWIDGCNSEFPSGVRTGNNSNCYEIDDGSRNVFVTRCRALAGVCGLQIKGHNRAPAPYNIVVSDFVTVNAILGVEVRHTGYYGSGVDEDPNAAVDENGETIYFTGASPNARNVALNNVLVVAPRNRQTTYRYPYEFGSTLPGGVTLKAIGGVRVRSYENVVMNNIIVSDGSLDLAGDFLAFDGMDNVPVRISQGAKAVHCKNLQVYGFPTNIGLGEYDTDTDVRVPIDPDNVAAVVVPGSLLDGVYIDGLTILNGPKQGLRALANAQQVSVTNYHIVTTGWESDADAYPIKFTGTNKWIGNGYASGYGNAVRNELGPNYTVRKSAITSGGTAGDAQPAIDLVWQEGFGQNLGNGEGLKLSWKARLVADTADYEVAYIASALEDASGDATRASGLKFAVSVDGTAAPVERARFDSAGRWLIGTPVSIATENGATVPHSQVHGNTQTLSSLGISNWSTSGLSDARYVFSKSKSGTVGTRGILASADQVGTIVWCGDDGVNFLRAAQIIATVDGTPALNSMPVRLDFYTRGAADVDAVRALRLGTDQSVTSSAGRYVARQSIVSAAGTTVLTAADHFVAVTGATTHTLTLPAAASGRVLMLKNRSGGTVTVNRAGADTIDGGTTFSLTANQGTTLVANGTDWCRVSNA